MISSKLLLKLTPQERKQLEESLKYFEEILKKISDSLKDDSKALEKEFVIPPKNVENWALQQAYMRGQQATYQKLINLLESKE